MTSSLLACIFTGLPRPSSVQSTLENDGITEPTWCLSIAVGYGESASFSNSARETWSTPWSIGYSPVPALLASYDVSPSPA